ncbi:MULTISPECIES: SDR family NAD(P)-dependent oxidoreductase [Bacillus]|uniref:3-oxoacyl-ACP reductase n=2 Tax=Bacillus TaxID=1386 RepID=A0A0M4FTI8_9BACI|nr:MULTISPECIES: SDR family oxidoreductase [Bacillus]ALC83021.1 3-oxoacyl-ACP reductase [Bacillus gobiensis]MBP1082046.1 NAD(P)-dependent dehydrogenase (short-subunit alcohol dehydrogenase family) [Bacillus capparidis]MED1096675.1 SDR family NAD(P)-dependent oxidoreductase [Bacillus capparidis]
MSYQLEGKVAIVTGANDGIGLATTKALLNEGAKVVGASLTIEDIKDLAGKDQFLPIALDLTEPGSCKKLVDAAISQFGQIDILANIAGIAIYKDSFLDVTDEIWERTFATNLFAIVRLTREAIPHMKKQKGASIINIASESGHVPDSFAIDYSASKAGVLNLTQALANEFGGDIRVNVVSPGPTRTEMWNKPGGMVDMLAEMFNKEREEAVSHFAKNVRQIPRGSIGQPEEIANVILFLASDKSSYVNGAEFPVNGGSVKYK